MCLACHRRVILDVSKYHESLALPEFGPRMVCTRCGAMGADPLTDYWLDYNESVLTLHFTLPFKTPVKAKLLKIDIFDPTIFVDLVFARPTPVRLVSAPAECKLDVAF
jgi:hypothetical protein